MAAKKTTTKKADSKVSVTVCGVTVKVSKDAINDVEVLDWVGQLTEGNVMVFRKLCDRLLGEAQYKKVVDALRNDEGICTVTAMDNYFTQLFSAINAVEAKN